MTRPDETSRPLIGLTTERAAGASRARDTFVLRRNYIETLSRAGATPLLLPHDPASIPHYAAMLDGLMITGGDFDIDPALFGESARHPAVKPDCDRTRFEWELTSRFLERDRPLFGICGGAQLLNVAFKGTLIQHIPDAVAGALQHEQPNPRHEPGHEVRLVEGSKLAALCGRSVLNVNSAHHQAVAKPGPGLTVNAHAPDGVVEGVEAAGRRFCLGVQWHPEYLVDEADARLFKAFVDACR